MVVPEPYVAYDHTQFSEWLSSLTPLGSESGSRPVREPQVHNLNGMTAASAVRAYERMLGVRAMDSRALDGIPSSQAISDPVTTTPQRPTPQNPAPDTTMPGTTTMPPSNVAPTPPADQAAADEKAKQAKLEAEQKRRAEAEARKNQQPAEQQPASVQPPTGNADASPSTTQQQPAPTIQSPAPTPTTPESVPTTSPGEPEAAPGLTTPVRQPWSLTRAMLGLQEPIPAQTTFTAVLDPIQFVRNYKPELPQLQNEPQNVVAVQVVATAEVSGPAAPGPLQTPHLTSSNYSAQQLAADKALVQQGRPQWVGPRNPYDAAIARLRAAEYTQYQQLVDLQWSQYRPQNEEEAESWRAAFRRLREGGIPWKDPAIQHWAQTQLQHGVLTDPGSMPRWAGPPVNISPTSPELHPLDKPMSAAVTAIVKSTAHSLEVLGDTIVNLSPHAEMRASVNARPGGDGKINAPVVPTRPEHSTLEVAIAMVDIGSYMIPIGAPGRIAAGVRVVAVGPSRVAIESASTTTRSLPMRVVEATTLPLVPRINTQLPNSTLVLPHLLRLPPSDLRPNGLVSNLVVYGREKIAQLDRWGDQRVRSFDLIAEVVAKFGSGPPPAVASYGGHYYAPPTRLADQAITPDSQPGPFIAFAKRGFGRLSDTGGAYKPKGTPHGRNSDVGSKNGKDSVGPHGTAVNRDSLKTPLTEGETPSGQTFLVDENGVPHVLADKWDTPHTRDGLNLLNAELKVSGQYLERGTGVSYFFQDDAARMIDGGNINGTVGGSTADLIRVTRKDGSLVSIKTVDVTGTSRGGGVSEGEISDHIATIVGKLPGGKKNQTQNVLFFADSRAQAVILSDIFKSRPEVRIMHSGSGFDSRPTDWL